VKTARVVALLKDLEGFLPFPYDDLSPWPRSEVGRADCELRAGQYKVRATGGTATIGFGETSAEFIDRYWGRQITQAEALAKMSERVLGFYEGVAGCINVDLTEHQWEAITCRAYQTGAGGFCRSQTAQLINAGRLDDAVEQWREEFAHPDRSEVEIAHFRTPDEEAPVTRPIVSPEEWGARAHGPLTPAPGMTRGVAIHWLGDTGAPVDHDECPAVMRWVEALHMDIKGWTWFAYNCLPAETEILTAEGWKLHTELVQGEEVLTLNHDTGLSEWQPLQAIHAYSGQHTLLVDRNGIPSTPNHRWPVERRVRFTGRERRRGPDGRWIVGPEEPSVEQTRWDRKFVTTEELSVWDRVPVAALCADVPTDPKYLDDLVELVAWFWTEGHIMKRRGKVIGTVAIYQSQSHNPANVARIRGVLTRLYGSESPMLRPRTDQPRWSSRLTGQKVTFYLNAAIGQELMRIAEVPDKVVRLDFIRSLTQAQLDLFIRVGLMGDGHQGVLAQKCRARTEALGFAILLSGHAPSFFTVPPTSSTAYPMHGVRVKKNHYMGPRWKGELATTQYVGTVWCPTTPNGTWYARYKGRCFFTGNCGVCPHGTTYMGRGPITRNAANGGGTRYGIDANAGWASILYFDSATGGPGITPEAADAINDAAVYLGVADGEWLGHRDFLSTECPGDENYAWVTDGHPRGTNPQPEPEDDMALPLFGDSPPEREYAFWMIDGAFKRKLITSDVWDDYQRLAQSLGLGSPKHIGSIPLAMFDALVDLDELRKP
jgi:GH24 family phage-related lysozyme (muramidase)